MGFMRGSPVGSTVYLLSFIICSAATANEDSLMQGHDFPQQPYSPSSMFVRAPFLKVRHITKDIDGLSLTATIEPLEHRKVLNVQAYAGGDMKHTRVAAYTIDGNSRFITRPPYHERIYGLLHRITDKLKENPGPQG
jgi:hypothetical protein